MNICLKRANRDVAEFSDACGWLARVENFLNSRRHVVVETRANRAGHFVQ